MSARGPSATDFQASPLALRSSMDVDHLPPSFSMPLGESARYTDTLAAETSSTAGHPRWRAQLRSLGRSTPPLALVHLLPRTGCSWSIPDCRTCSLSSTATIDDGACLSSVCSQFTLITSMISRYAIRIHSVIFSAICPEPAIKC